MVVAVIKAGIIFTAFFLVASVTHWMIRRYQDRFSSVIQTCLQTVEKPISLLLLISGLYFAQQVVFLPEWIGKWSDIVYFVAVAVVFAYVLDRISSVAIRRWLRRQDIYEKTPELINKTISIIIYVIVLLVILDQYNIEISPFIATLGIGGVAVGLALQDTLKDFFAGVHIISDRPIRVGDYVEIHGDEGFVTDIGWRSTRIKTILGNHIIIPNSKLASSTIQNDSMPDNQMKIRVECGVDYDSDLDRVEQVVYDVAEEVQEEVEGAVDEHDPFVRFLKFGDSNIILRVVLQISQYVRKYKVESEFIKRLHKRFQAEDIEISWPVRKIYDMDEAS